MVHEGYFLVFVCKIWRKELILKGFKGVSWACKGFKVRRLSIFTCAIFDKVDEKWGYLGKKYNNK